MKTKSLIFISLPIFLAPTIAVVSCSSSSPNNAIMGWTLDHDKIKKEAENKDQFNLLPNNLDKLLKIIKGNRVSRYTEDAFSRGYFNKIEFTSNNKLEIQLEQESPYLLPNKSKLMEYKF